MNDELPPTVTRFLAAVEARDSHGVAECFAEDAVYHFLVPRAPVEGRTAIEAAFAKVLGETSRVKWEVVTSGVAGDRVFLERVDRFWFGEREAAIECLGVFEITGSLITSVRDYADHQTWQARKEHATPASP